MVAKRASARVEVGQAGNPQGPEVSSARITTVRWVACRKLGHHGVKSRLLGATVLVPAIGCHGIGVEDDAI